MSRQSPGEKGPHGAAWAEVLGAGVHTEGDLLKSMPYGGEVGASGVSPRHSQDQQSGGGSWTGRGVFAGAGGAHRGRGGCADPCCTAESGRTGEKAPPPAPSSLSL